MKTARTSKNTGKAVRKAKPMRKAERRIQLLAAARKIIHDQGIGALTMSALAERTGAVKPVVYEHFANSEAVAVALMDEYVERLSSFVVARVERAQTIDEYIDIMVDALFDFQSKELFQLRCITNGLTSNFDNINKVYGEYKTMSINVFKSLLEQQGIEESASYAAAYGIHEMIGGIVFEFSRSSLESSARLALKKMLKGIIHSLMTKSGPKPFTPMDLLGRKAG